MNRHASIFHPPSASSTLEQPPSCETLISAPFNSVSWGQTVPSFELSSNDPAILARAEIIFRPWRCAQPGEPVRHWWVEQSDSHNGDSAGRWKIWSDASNEVSFGNTPGHALMMVEFLAVEALIEHPDGPLSLHGALVEKDGKGAVILGGGGAGKSTLACALWQRGWTTLCDDTTLVEAELARAYPAPRRVSLRSPSRDLLGEELWARISATPSCDRTSEGCLFHPDEVDLKRRSDSTPLAALIFLGRRGSSAGSAKLERLEPAHALLALLPYSNIIRRVLPGEAIRRISPLADVVAAYDLGRGPLEEMVQSVEQLLAQGD